MAEEVNDYMINYVNNHILDGAEISKTDIKVFLTYSDLALHLYDGDFDRFLADIDGEYVRDEHITLLENLFQDNIRVFEDESYGYIYYLDI